MTASQFLLILRARKRIALAVWLAVFCLSAVLSVVLPKRFETTASVVIDARAADPITGNVPQTPLASSYLSTQVDVINSPRVAQRVVQLAKLADDPTYREGWQKDTQGRGEFEDWAAARLLAQVKARPARDSNVIYITGMSSDPVAAKLLANTFAKAYVDTTLTLRVEPAKEYSVFFEKQAQKARETLEAAQSNLSQFQRSRGLIVTDEKLDVENNRLAELSSQLVDLQSQAGNSVSRQAQAGANSRDLQEVTGSPVVASLKTEVSVAAARHRELRERLGDNHPDLLEAQAKVQELQRRLNEETGTLARGVGLSNRVNQQRLGMLETSIEKQRAKVLAMKADRDEAAVLQRDVENAQKAFDAVVNRVNQSSLESQTQLSNVSILSPAPLPIHPAFPLLSVNLGIGAVAGAILALIIAVSLEVFDRRVRSASDITEVLNLDVIGKMPLRRALPAGKSGALPGGRGRGAIGWQGDAERRT